MSIGFVSRKEEVEECKDRYRSSEGSKIKYECRSDGLYLVDKEKVVRIFQGEALLSLPSLLA